MSIGLSFLGASGTVTGSCYRLQTGSADILVDCGMFQGSKALKELNYQPFPFDASRLDAVILTHAHIDHSGLLPKLTRAGYRGPIFTTPATVDLLGCMLPDSAHIQESEVERLNRRGRWQNRDALTPIYTIEDAQKTLKQLEPVKFEEWRRVAGDIRARWWNAGHLLGSGSIEVEIGPEGATPLKLLFSGDIGPDNKLLQPEPEAPQGFDYVICESTYGDRDRIDASENARRAVLADELKRARIAGGPVLIPSFAIERTQELMADLSLLMDAGAIPATPVFVDSPLAGLATQVFRRHAGELDHGDALLAALSSPSLKLMETVEQSKSLSRLTGFHVIIAASGMCDAGRIRHHLKHWLPMRSATVLLCGYQGRGTLGAQLKDGEDRVRIMGDEVMVKAAIRSMDSYSGHADGPELLAWLRERGRIRKGLFLTHGEPVGLDGLRARVIAAGLLEDAAIITPQLDDRYELQADRARLVSSSQERRIAPEAVLKPGPQEDLSRLMISINQAYDKAADDRTRGVILRKLQRALSEDAAGREEASG